MEAGWSIHICAVVLASVVAVSLTQECSDPVVPNGDVLAGSPWTFRDGYQVGSRLQVTCNDGYQLVPPTSPFIECVRDGDRAKWIGSNKYLEEMCSGISQCLIPSIRNGYLWPLDRADSAYYNNNGDVAGVRCNNGHVLNPPGYAAIMCLGDGTWRTGLSTMPTCLAEGCTAPPSLENGYSVAMLDGLHIDLDNYESTIPSGTTVYFFCNSGFRISGGDPVWQCSAGSWTLTSLTCEPVDFDLLAPATCFPPDPIPNGVTKQAKVYPNGQHFFPCEDGFTLSDPSASSLQFCRDGRWEFIHKTPSICLPILPGCQQPPELTNGSYKYTHTDWSLRGGYIANGTVIQYYCDSDFMLQLHSAGPVVGAATAVCNMGHWVGDLPFCAKRTRCDPPPTIENGNWVIANMVRDFGIGARIVYECTSGYRAVSGLQETVLECQDSGYWSENPPRCLAIDMPCDVPPPIPNGFVICQPENCNLFRPGTKIEYACVKGYVLSPMQVKLIECNAHGQWPYGYDLFRCVQDHGAFSPTDKSSSHSSSTSVGAVTIVVGTSCGVLGLLLIVMILFLFKRRKGPALRSRNAARPLQSICGGGNMQPPPAYSELPVANTAVENGDSHHLETAAVVADHDRLSLIQFADGTQATLPSYDEVTRGRYPPRLHRFNSDRSARSVTSGGDYRPLPAITNQVRQQNRELSPADHRDQVSISSNPRTDGLSVTFGSIDTMNVSDNTSTTVTLGTYDSGASNPSLATSQHACAGSMNSSSPSVNAEDAPLLESYDALSHRSQTASPAIPEEDESEAI